MKGLGYSISEEEEIESEYQKGKVLDLLEDWKKMFYLYLYTTYVNI